MTNLDELYMGYALAEARASGERGEVPVGAVIVGGHRVLSRAGNQCEALHDVSAHAEILAIGAAQQALGGGLLAGCTLYVTLEPCAMCAGAIGWARPSRLVFAAHEPKSGYTRFSPSPLHRSTAVESGLLAEESLGLLRAFFSSRRR